MSSIITLLLTLIGQLLPALGTSASIQNIVNALIGIVPALIQEAVDMVPIVQNIIAALQNNPATTSAQMVTLQSLDAQCDAAFEAALASSTQSDPAGTVVPPDAGAQPPAAPTSLFGDFMLPPLDAQGLRLDGPTLAEWVAHGYPAETYPPAGYAVKEAAPPVPGT